MSNSPVVVITGVSSGIGRTTAEQFARRGCRVFGSVRNPATAQAILGVELIQLDIRDEASIRHSVDHVIAQAGRIAWKMRHTPKGEATLLRRLRRFMPAGPVDSGLRKTFGLG